MKVTKKPQATPKVTMLIKLPFLSETNHVTATMIPEETARAIAQERRIILPIPVPKPMQLSNNVSNFVLQPRRGNLSTQFQKLLLAEIGQRKRESGVSVVAKKYAILFWTTVDFGSGCYENVSRNMYIDKQ